jgi:hypothetical protein
MKKMVIAIMMLSLVLVGGNALAGTYNNAEVNDVTAFVDNSDNSVNDSNVTNRQFVNPGNTPLPQTNGFFTSPTPDSSFRSIRDILRVFGDGQSLRVELTEGALEEMARGGDVKSHLQIVRGNAAVPRAEAIDGVKYLIVGIEAPIIKDNKVIGTAKIDGLKSTGFVDGEADDGDTNSIQVLGKMGLKALKDGNNYMIITAEGAHRKVEASGWGIGFYTVIANVSDGGTTSGLGGGGTGYAQNETGPEDRPWMQGYVGVK